MNRSLCRGVSATAIRRPITGALAALRLCAVLLLQATAAVAATLSEDMVQASQDACVSLAKRRGFTVEQVIQAQPASGDSASVVLKLKMSRSDRAQALMRSGAVVSWDGAAMVIRQTDGSA